MKKLLRLAGLSVMALSLSSGVAAAATASIDETGPDSTNKVEFENRTRVKVDNENHVRVYNSNPQTAVTGDARVRHNTTGGDATSGDASNDSLLRSSLSLRNTSSSLAALEDDDSGDNDGTIATTGPDSYNKILFADSRRVTVENYNNVNVENHNSQTAVSGDAKVEDNTTGGDAASGGASNVSTLETTLEVEN
jgi:hypothetical protein